MKEFTVAEIRKWKRSFAKDYSKGIFVLDDKSIEYFVLPQKINPELPDFIYRQTNSKSDNYLIGVSDSVPMTLRPYFAYGEYLEFMEFGPYYENRILESQKEVLEVIPSEYKQEYISKIVPLFKKEIELSIEKPKKYPLTDDDRFEFKKAISYIKKTQYANL